MRGRHSRPLFASQSDEGEPMNIRGCSTWILMAGLASGASGQTQTAPAQGQTGATSAPKPAVKRKRTTPRAAAPVQTIPIESAPPSAPPAPVPAAQQKADDARLLQQQRQQSAQAAQVTNQQVQQAQKQKDSVQNEVRIQDAPGPAQTGVVPAAGAPVAPVNSQQRIQDAPGPAQTLPQLPAAQPGTIPQTTTAPPPR